jgi:lysophospholipase L1-like esterase
LGLATTASATPAKVGPPSRVTALGDSITRAYDSQGSGCVAFTDCPAFSWATGSNATVNSYFRRLQVINPSAVLSNSVRGNDAVTGAKVADLNGQATAAIAGNPDLVLILIGANDVCTSSEAAMTSVTDFRTRFTTAMNTLSTNLPDARIQVMSIPNIFNLWNVLKGNFLAQLTWAAAGICQSMLANPTSTSSADTQRRLRVQQRNIDFNTQLQQVCAGYIHCRYDGGAAYNLAFAASDVSTLDYFHPNVSGQSKAAATAFGATFTYSDLTAPITTISRDRPADGVNDWYRNNVTVSVSATDPGGSVSGSEFFQLQGAGSLPWTPYTTPFTISSEGITNVTARTVDASGNINASTSTAIKVDKTAPTFTLTCPTQVPMSSSASIAISNATDTLSGFVAAQNAVTPIDTSTVGHFSHTAQISDQAGNTTTHSCSWDVVDITAPTISITSPADGESIAQNAVVAAHYGCADEAGGSGLATCVATVSDVSNIDTSSLGSHAFTVNASDNAGNPSTRTVHYTVVDVTPPSITITSPTDAQSIPQHDLVAADYSCADEAGGSGLATCSGTVASGANVDTAALGSHIFSVDAEDNAGNPNSKSVTYTVIDVTAPTITIDSPLDNALIPRNALVAADYSCADEPDGSGLANCDGPVATGANIDTADLGSHSFTVQAVDNSGNPSTKTVTYSVIDVTPPTITINAPVDGAAIAQHAVVGADYACADEAGGSGVATCVGTVGNGAAIDTATLGVHTFTVDATDNADNPSTSTVTYTVVDVTAPTITVTTPPPGQTFLLGQAATAAFSCADEADGSGLASCVGTVANGSSLDTSSVGTKTVTVNASDNAGNPSTKTVTYGVRYRFGGVLQPVNADGSSIFKAGSTVPVKFQLFDAANAPISTANATLTYAKISNNVVGSDVEAMSTAAATSGNAFRYDTSSQQYIFNLSTKGWATGSYRLTIHSLNDTQDYSVVISVR